MKERHNGLYKRCECAKRTWPKCSHGWHFAFKWKGARHRFSLDRHTGKHVDNKTDAEAIAGKLRDAIREGKLGQPAPLDDMTLRQLADIYVERYVDVERKGTRQAYVWGLDAICATPITIGKERVLAFGSWRVADLVTDTIERFREARRAGGTGVVGTNRHLGMLRAVFNWAVRTGYVDATPFKRGTEPVVKLSDEPTRSRRFDVDTDEEDRLLAMCGEHLRAVVEAALETGMRRGEILSLQWKQVDGCAVEQDKNITWAPRAELVLPWMKTKTRRDRRIPISSRLKLILEMRRFDPAGKPHDEDRYVFGNAIGQQISDVGRAWETALLRAYSYAPSYVMRQLGERTVKTANLSPESRKKLAEIDLHFHDLRREAGSRWLEGGVPLHTIRDWLGHTSIAQTSTYLSGTMRAQHDAMKAFENRRAAVVAQRGNRSRTGGRKSPQPAETSDRKPNKTGADHDQTMM